MLSKSERKYRQVINVFLASPGDLQPEREAAKQTVKWLNQVLVEMGLTIDLLIWENTTPGVGRPQELINDHVRSCDLFVGMLWQRWGQSTGKTDSGFLEEYSLASELNLGSGKPQIWLYFKSVQDAQLRDPGPQLQKVLDFKKSVRDRRELLSKTFDTTEEWTGLVRDSLLKHCIAIAQNSANSQNSQYGDSSPQPVVPEPPEYTLITGQAREVLDWIAKETSPEGQDWRFSVDRLSLLSTALQLPYSHTSLGSHEINSLYRSKEIIQPEGLEAYTLLRTLIGDFRSRVCPGWYWFREMDPSYLSSRLFSLATRDPIPTFRANAINMLCLSEVKLTADQIAVLLKDKSNEVLSATQSYLMIKGESQELLLLTNDVITAYEGFSQARETILLKSNPQRLPALLSGPDFKHWQHLRSLFQRVHSGFSDDDLKEVMRCNVPHFRFLSFSELLRRGHQEESFIRRGLTDGSWRIRHAALKRLLSDSVGVLSLKEVSEAVGGVNDYSPFDYIERELSWIETLVTLFRQAARVERPAEKAIPRTIYLDDALLYGIEVASNIDQKRSELLSNLQNDFEPLRQVYDRTWLHMFGARDIDELVVVMRSKGFEITQEFFNPEPRMRSFVARQYTIFGLLVLVALPSRADLSVLRLLIKHNDPEVRSVALLGLSTWGDDQDFTLCFEIASSGGGAFQTMAVRSALRMASNKRVAIQRLFGLQQPDIIREILAATVDLSEVVDDLVNLLLSENSAVRLMAIRALSQTWAKEALADLLDRYVNLDRYYYDVIKGFVKAFSELFGPAGKLIGHPLGEALPFLVPTSSAFEELQGSVADSIAEFARVEGIGDDPIKRAAEFSQWALEKYGTNMDDLARLDFNPDRARTSLLARVRDKMRLMDEPECQLVDLLLQTVYTTALKGSKYFDIHMAAFREILGRLKDPVQPALTLQSLQLMASSALLVDPTRTWNPDRDPDSALLSAERTVVRFIGDQAESAKEGLVRWCQQDGVIRVHLLSGSGGAGKTRLGLEVCRMLRPSWITGFLSREAEDAQSWALDHCLNNDQDQLIIIDEADQRTDVVVRILRPAARRTGRAKLRLLLIGRSPQEWWSFLQRQPNGVGDLLRGKLTTVSHLPALRAQASAREELYHISVEDLQAALGYPREGLPLPDISGSDFGQILFIQLAAYASILGLHVSSAEQLLHDLLGRERQQWDVWLGQQHMADLAGRPVSNSLAYLSVLGGAATLEQVESILETAPLMDGQPAARIHNLAAMARELYAGEGNSHIPGVVPGLLAEKLVTEEISAALVGRVAERSDSQVQQALLVLNRIGKRLSSSREWIRMLLLSGDLERLAVLAFTVTDQEGEPLGGILSELLMDLTDHAVAARLLGQIPSRTTGLREVAGALASILWRAYQEGKRSVPDLPALSLLGRRFLQAGKSEQAKLVSREVITQTRSLPNELRGNALVDCANVLLEVDEPREALELADQAVSLLRDGSSDDLAVAFDIRSRAYESIGKLEESLADIRESMRRIEASNEKGPPTPRLRQRLAVVMDTYAGQIYDREPKAAVDYTQRAQTIFSELSADNPFAYAEETAQILNNLANRVGGMGDHEQARHLIQEAIALGERLTEDYPDIFRYLLAGANYNAGKIFLDQEDFSQALARCDTSIGLWTSEVDRDVRNRWHVAQCLNLKASILGKMGKKGEAIKSGREAVKILKELVPAGEFRYRESLVTTIGNLADREYEVDGVTSLPTYLDAIRNARDLAAENPSFYVVDLVKRLIHYCRRLGSLGKSCWYPDMRAAVREAFRLRDDHPGLDYPPELIKQLSDLAGKLGVTVPPSCVPPLLVDGSPPS
jgi:tetratricopeptide (TPR) repeat protein